MIIARGWCGATAAVVLVGLLTQLLVTANAATGRFDTTATRVLNVFCFFTIQANILVGLTCLLLAVGPDRTSTLFRVLRLDALVGIAVTGVVFHLALASLQDLHGSAAFADFCLHTLSPILCVLGWVLFGPRRRTPPRIVGLTVVFPLAWLVFTLIRGTVIGYYPYPFLDVTGHGYGRVLLSCGIVAVLFLALAGGAGRVDDRAGVPRAG